MIISIFQSILDKLQTDNTLIGYGVATSIYRAHPGFPLKIPSITVFENNEKSKPRVGYVQAHVRDNAPTVQVDIWVNAESETFPMTGEDADTIANRVDYLLLNARSPVTGTRAGTWVKTTSSQQFEEDTRIWHNALRYTFEYSVTDT